MLFQVSNTWLSGYQYNFMNREETLASTRRHLFATIWHVKNGVLCYVKRSELRTVAVDCCSSASSADRQLARRKKVGSQAGKKPETKNTHCRLTIQLPSSYKDPRQKPDWLRKRQASADAGKPICAFIVLQTNPPAACSR